MIATALADACNAAAVSVSLLATVLGERSTALQHLAAASLAVLQQQQDSSASLTLTLLVALRSLSSHASSAQADTDAASAALAELKRTLDVLLRDEETTAARLAARPEAREQSAVTELQERLAAVSAERDAFGRKAAAATRRANALRTALRSSEAASTRAAASGAVADGACGGLDVDDFDDASSAAPTPAGLRPFRLPPFFATPSTARSAPATPSVAFRRFAPPRLDRYEAETEASRLVPPLSPRFAERFAALDAALQRVVEDTPLGDRGGGLFSLSPGGRGCGSETPVSRPVSRPASRPASAAPSPRDAEQSERHAEQVSAAAWRRRAAAAEAGRDSLVSEADRLRGEMALRDARLGALEAALKRFGGEAAAREAMRDELALVEAAIAGAQAKAGGGEIESIAASCGANGGVEGDDAALESVVVATHQPRAHAQPPLGLPALFERRRLPRRVAALMCHRTMGAAGGGDNGGGSDGDNGGADSVDGGSTPRYGFENGRAGVAHLPPWGL